jgi:catechol 2,3-dioxygenase-like lactoylglutathione lyase family enzyme
MPFKFSRYVCIQTSDQQSAVDFYARILDTTPIRREGYSPQFDAGMYRLFVDEGQPIGPILEFLTPDLDVAHAELVEAGCTILRWDGKGGPCYVRDPFGMVFNLHEDPEAF